MGSQNIHQKWVQDRKNLVVLSKKQFGRLLRLAATRQEPSVDTWFNQPDGVDPTMNMQSENLNNIIQVPHDRFVQMTQDRRPQYYVNLNRPIRMDDAESAE